MKRLILTAACLLALTGTAQARPAAGSALLRAHALAQATQVITVVNQANVSPKVLAKVEAATLAEVNGPLHHYWHTPVIRFGRDGWKLALVYSMYNLPFSKGGCDWHGGGQGCHAYEPNAKMTPFMTISTWRDRWSDGMPPQWTQAFAHEIIETLADEDPRNQIGEICDDTGDSAYQVANGVILPDFETPAGRLAPEIN